MLVFHEEILYIIFIDFLWGLGQSLNILFNTIALYIGYLPFVY